MVLATGEEQKGNRAGACYCISSSRRRTFHSRLRMPPFVEPAAEAYNHYGRSTASVTVARNGSTFEGRFRASMMRFRPRFLAS